MVFFIDIVSTVIAGIISYLIFALNRIPFFNVLCCLAPLPVIVVICRKNVYYGIAGMAIASALVYYSGTLILALVYMFFTAITAFFIGTGIRRGIAMKRIVAFTAVVLILLVFSVVFYLKFTYGMNLVKTAVLNVNNFFMNSINEIGSKQNYRTLSKEGILALKETLEYVEVLILSAYPSIIICFGFIVAYANYALSRILTRKHGPALQESDLFGRLKFSDLFVWVLIAGISFGLCYEYLFSTSIVYGFAANLLVFSFCLYFMQGLAVIRYFFEKWKFPKLIQAVGFLIIMIMNTFVWIMVLSLGIFDTWFDFRKIINKTEMKNA